MKLAVVRVVQRLVIVMIQVKFKQWLPHNSWWVEKSGYCERGISTRCMEYQVYKCSLITFPIACEIRIILFIAKVVISSTPPHVLIIISEGGCLSSTRSMS